MPQTKTRRPAKPADPPAPTAERLTLALPIDEAGPLVIHAGYCSTRIDAKLTRRQAGAAKLLACTLSQRGVRAHGGKVTHHPRGATVETSADAVRLLLDLVADAVETSEGRSLEDDYGLKFS